MINFNRIEDALFVGSAPQNSIDIARLAQMKVTAVLSLQSDDDHKLHQINWAELQKGYEQQGIVVQRFPVIDFSEADLGAKLPQPVKALARLLTLDHRVYVHCNAGICRAPATVVTYFCHFREMEKSAALAYLRQHRPQVHPYMTSVDMALTSLQQSTDES